MAFNGMSSVPSVSQRTLAVTATQFSSFATPAITVPFPSVYGGQSQIPFTFTGTATWAATRVPTTLGGAAATAGVHSINSQASAAGYRTHDYGNSGSGGGWPTWATAVIAACGGAAIILLVLGLWCWRHRRKQKAARKRAAAAGYGQDEGKRRRKMSKHGAAYTEEPTAMQNNPRRNRAAAAAAVGAAGAGAAGRSRSNQASASRSQSRTRRAGTLHDYPVAPGLAGGVPDSPSRNQIRSRDLAALGISRPSSASPSIRRQYEQDPATHPNAYPVDGLAYPAFAVPRERRSRDFSNGSQNGLLAPVGPFAYQEGDTRGSGGGGAGYRTPPRRSPNTAWGEFDSPGQNGSPARLLGSAEKGAYGYADDTPRSSMTMSTRGTGGGAYRWDRDPDLDEHMPDAAAVSAALGRAMMGESSIDGHDAGVGMTYGGPDDGSHWANDSRSLSTHGYGAHARAPELRRSTTPTYAPPETTTTTTTAATSRAPSRQRDVDSARTSTYGHHHRLQRSTTPDGPPIGALHAPIVFDGRTDAHGHGRSGIGESAGYSREGRNVHSRASTYATAEDAEGQDEYGAPKGAYAR
ncbi:hypothetical protein DMC30DRAFT_1487 [Rhodotorula diobovata]|uniref:Uncharacterized protein n=1 Tax=Rhodotorula diobovata TaxID=5288 RepID=A0A5C5G8E9_9BASI|nr:hypothetical protein DMC30DRAFT_1487 [Rhodotorula diobovata]